MTINQCSQMILILQIMLLIRQKRNQIYIKIHCQILIQKNLKLQFNMRLIIKAMHR